MFKHISFSDNDSCFTEDAGYQKQTDQQARNVWAQENSDGHYIGWTGAGGRNRSPGIEGRGIVGDRMTVLKGGQQNVQRFIFQYRTSVLCNSKAFSVRFRLQLCQLEHSMSTTLLGYRLS